MQKSNKTYIQEIKEAAKKKADDRIDKTVAEMTSRIDELARENKKTRAETEYPEKKLNTSVKPAQKGATQNKNQDKRN